MRNTVVKKDLSQQGSCEIAELCPTKSSRLGGDCSPFPSIMSPQDQESVASAPLALTTPAPPLDDGMAMGLLCAFEERATSSFNITSLVERVNSSTSADVRPVVGIGSRTSQVGQFTINERTLLADLPFTGIVPELKTRFFT